MRIFVQDPPSEDGWGSWGTADNGPGDTGRTSHSTTQVCKNEFTVWFCIVLYERARVCVCVCVLAWICVTGYVRVIRK